MLEINKIYHGDCLEVMESITDKSIDCIICDLPYEMISCKWDSIIPFDKLWQQYERIRKETAPVLLFSSQPFTTKLINSNYDNYSYELVWEKNVPTGMVQAKYRPMKYHETIQCFYMKNTTYNPIMKNRMGKGKDCYKYDHYCGKNNHIQVDKIKKRYDTNYVQPSTILKFDVVPNRNGKIHPTQKPTALLEYLIKTYSNEGDLILDNCSGSGSLAIACHNIKRNFICIEKDKQYYNLSVERYNNIKSQLKIF